VLPLGISEAGCSHIGQLASSGDDLDRIASIEVAMSEIEVRDNSVELRYEALADGRLVGEIRYRIEPLVIVLVHTEVAPSAEGQHIGSRMVEAALDDIRARGLRVVPLCPFVAGYIHRHPQYADLITSDPATPT
jgi:predicted GNAT family acetyltransferase